MKSLGYGDITKVQRPKLLQELPEIDIVITMGCNVACPMIKCKYREDGDYKTLQENLMRNF